MARTRNIKPAFFDNDILGSLDPLIRLLFIGLWCIADRDGRLEDRPRRIKKTLLGYDDATAEETNGMLEQLAKNGFIIRYKSDGEQYIQVVNFTKHQNPNIKEKPSEIPPPPGFDMGTYENHKTGTVQATCQTDADATTKETATPKAETEEPAQQSLIEMRFATFWNAYPNKKAKANALKAWRKIKPSAELFEKIMRAIETQKRSIDWTKDNGAYIPHPATWLNGGRWDDEINEVRTSGENRQSTCDGSTSTAYQSQQDSDGVPEGFHGS